MRFNRKAKSDAANYRGVHPTVQLSKVVERVVGRMFLSKLQREGSFGDRQFAYSIGRGHREALALFVSILLSRLASGYLVGFYCSDVCDAFDRVSEERLAEKLRHLGLHPQIFGLFDQLVGATDVSCRCRWRMS